MNILTCDGSYNTFHSLRSINCAQKMLSVLAMEAKLAFMLFSNKAHVKHLLPYNLKYSLFRQYCVFLYCSKVFQFPEQLNSLL